MAGSGLDIGGTADQFHFVEQPLSGDFQIVARVTGVPNTSSSSKAGIMIRESADDDSTNVAVVLANGRFQFQQRATTSAKMTYTSGTQGVPEWLRLVRTNDTFTGYRSTDGISWISLGSYTVPMADAVLAGSP